MIKAAGLICSFSFSHVSKLCTIRNKVTLIINEFSKQSSVYTRCVEYKFIFHVVRIYNAKWNYWSTRLDCNFVNMRVFSSFLITTTNFRAQGCGSILKFV